MLRWLLLAGVFVSTVAFVIACSENRSSSDVPNRPSEVAEPSRADNSESPAGSVARLAVQALINHDDGLYRMQTLPECAAACVLSAWDLAECVISNVHVPAHLELESVSVTFSSPCGHNSSDPGGKTTGCAFVMTVTDKTRYLSSAPECGS